MRRPRYSPPPSAPDPKTPGFGQWLLAQFRLIGEDLSGVAIADVDATISQERLDLPSGAVRRVSPTTSGTAVTLAAPSPDNAGETATLFIENPRGTVTVTATPHIGQDGKVEPSLINGERQGTFSRSGAVVFHSNGVDQWKTSAEPPGETTTAAGAELDLALGAEVLLGAAHPSFPSGRVATDSTEIDAVLTVAGVVSWALNTASVAFSKLANLAGLSVLGRAASTSGVMAAITATAANQRLVSDGTASSLVWVSDLPTSYLDTVTGTLTDYVLPSGFRSGDTLRLTITGNVTLNSIVFFGSVQPSEGFEMNLCLSDQSGGSAPGFSISIPDGGTSTHSAAFRTPGQVQGTVPGPDYVMQSEEEGARLAYQTNAWRIISGTAAQAITGDITVPPGNGSTRTAAITAGVIVNGDINASAAIALSKLATQNANTVVANATGGSAVPTAVAVGTNTVLGRVAGNIVAAALVNAQVDAAAAIAVSKLANGAALTVLANATNGSAAHTDVAATAASDAVFRESGSTLGFGTVATGGIANNAVTDTKIRDSGALSVIGRSANSSGDPADITASAASDAVLRESGSTVGFGTVAAGGLANAIISPAKLAVIASNIGAVFTIFVTVTAGTPGSADDVTIYSSDAPFAFRILDVTWLDSTAIALSTVELRDTAGGGGAALSSVLTAAVTGTARNNDTQTRTVAANGSVFLRRSDQGVAGDLVILAVRT